MGVFKKENLIVNVNEKTDYAIYLNNTADSLNFSFSSVFYPKNQGDYKLPFRVSPTESLDRSFVIRVNAIDNQAEIITFTGSYKINDLNLAGLLVSEVFKFRQEEEGDYLYLIPQNNFEGQGLYPIEYHSSQWVGGVSKLNFYRFNRDMEFLNEEMYESILDGIPMNNQTIRLTLNIIKALKSEAALLQIDNPVSLPESDYKTLVIGDTILGSITTAAGFYLRSFYAASAKIDIVEDNPGPIKPKDESKKPKGLDKKHKYNQDDDEDEDDDDGTNGHDGQSGGKVLKAELLAIVEEYQNTIHTSPEDTLGSRNQLEESANLVELMKIKKSPGTPKTPYRKFKSDLSKVFTPTKKDDGDSDDSSSSSCLPSSWSIWNMRIDDNLSQYEFFKEQPMDRAILSSQEEEIIDSFESAPIVYDWGFKASSILIALMAYETSYYIDIQ